MLMSLNFSGGFLKRKAL